MLVSIYSHGHCCIWGVLSSIGSVSGLTSPLYLFTTVLLQIIVVTVSAALSLVPLSITNCMLSSSVGIVSSIGILTWTVAVDGSLLPVRVVLIFVWVMDDGAWLINTYLRRLNRCIRLVVIALMHCTSETCVHGWLVSTTLKTVSQHVWVLLVRLISRPYHLVLMSVRLSHLLGSIDILIITLYIFEVDRVLWGVDELRVTTYLIITIWSTGHSLSLINSNSLARLLRSPSWCSSWVLSWLDDEAILRNILNHPIVDKTLVFHRELLELDLLLHLHGVLLLRRKVVSTVQHLSVLVLVVKCTVSRTDLHGAAIGVLLNVGIRIRVFAREKPLLGCSFSVINHPLVWTWAFTLSKMYNVFETVGLVLLRNSWLIPSTHLLVHLVLLLTRKCLLELKLLLQFLLLVGQDWVFALWLTTGLIVELFLSVLRWSHYGSHKSIRSIHHHGVLLWLHWRHVHWVSHGAGVATTDKLTTFLLLQSIGSLHNFVLVAWVLSGVIHRRIITGLNNWIWHTFMLILVGIYI